MQGIPTNAAAFSTTPIPDSGILAFVRESGLVPARADTRFTPLTGGVSSGIWKVEAEGALFVVKRARGERTAKWNEALRIEEQLGPRARFAGWGGLRCKKA
jgi:Enolase, C-terminal TIM barrel domain